MSGGRTECTFTWFIENYTYCSYDNDEELLSPEFTLFYLDSTVWRLNLFPRGNGEKNKGNLSVFLYRGNDDGPEKLPLKCELSVLDANGKALVSRNLEYTFEKEASYGWPKFLKMEKVLNPGRTAYFPDNNLRLLCKLWKGEGNIHSVTQISARTRIGIEKISFCLEVGDFSTLKPNQKKTILVNSSSKKGLALSCTLSFTDGPCCHGRIIIDIVPTDNVYVLSECKIALLDKYRHKIICGEANNRFEATWKNIQNIPLSLLRQEILNKKQEYLPDDKLSLSFECTFASGVEYEKIEETHHEKAFLATSQIKVGNNVSDTCAQQLSCINSATDDLQEVYNNQFLADMEIKTKTKSFPAHKIVLCARSPVFKVMMSNDMKEKNSNIIQIDDLEDDIVQKLLLFLYSDNLENLQWESANRLYYAADKYSITKLKKICSAFLIENVTAPSVSELLLLADKHNDCDLKKAAEDFIFNHETQVYGSDEWINLLSTNPTLVSTTMMRMYTRNLEPLECL